MTGWQPPDRGGTPPGGRSGRAGRAEPCRAVLELARAIDHNPMVPAEIRGLAEDDWGPLAELFVASFLGVPPFAGLTESCRDMAARLCLEQTRTGGDGALIAPACRVAVESGGRSVGAILITSPDGSGPDPHLTWIFVAPGRAGLGLGSALLADAARALARLGEVALLSSFLPENIPSLMWHWRNDFRLLPRGPRGDGGEGSGEPTMAH